MATFSQNDVLTLFVGAAATKTTGAPSTLNDGEIGLFNPAGTRLTEANAATNDEFVIMRGVGAGEIIQVSGIINKNDIVDATANVQAYSAATSKVVSVGYNGTSGSIDAQNDTDYMVRVNMREGRTSNHGGVYVKHGYYSADSSATQEEIVAGLHLSLVNEFSKEPGDPVLVQAYCDHAGASIGAAADTIVGVAGSRYLVITDTGGDTSVIATSAGDWFRAGTATTDPVYKIKVGTGTGGGTMELETPLQAAVNLVGNTCEYITNAQAAAGNLGLTLTAQEPTMSIGKLHSDLQQVDFDVTLQGFGTTTAVTDTDNDPGIGTQVQVQELEFFAQGNEGDYMRMGEPNIYASRAQATGNYDLLTFQVRTNYQGSVVSGPINKTYMLAVPETAPNYAIAATADDITDVLEVLIFGAAGGELAIT